MILKIFSPKKSAKKWRFFTQDKGKLCRKKLTITLVFEKNAIFFVENWQNSPKIVIITSTPEANPHNNRLVESTYSSKPLNLLLPVDRQFWCPPKTFVLFYVGTKFMPSPCLKTDLYSFFPLTDNQTLIV
jgi:hypothetical protein